MRSELWMDGDCAVLFSEDKAAVREILSWKPMIARGVSIMAEYEDRKGRLFALQIRFPVKLRNRVARRMGLAEEKQRLLVEADKIAHDERIRNWRFEPCNNDADLAA